MEAKELMINDWLMHNDDTPMQVSVIKQDCFACGNAPHLYDYNNEFSPIPLTPKILEANGWFEIFEGAWEGDIALDKRYTKKYYIKNTSIGITYVHQLQQALRLCGLADLANNFKIE